MEHRLITFWSAHPGAGARTIATELGRQWNLEERSTLILAPVSSPLAEKVAAPPVREWLERFRNLSPMLLRNYLAAAGCSRLPISELPDAQTLKELLLLLRRAFEW